MMLRVQRERMNGGFFPTRARVQPRATASTRAAWPRCPDHAIVMHPGPMNRGMEITADVADSARSVIVEQVTNGVARADGGALPAAGRQRTWRVGGDDVTTYLIKGAAVLGGEPTDLLLDGRRASPRWATGSPPRAPRSSTPPVSSRCPAWSTCTPTCASPAARTPRRSRPARRPRPVGGFTAVHAMANTDPVADTAGVVEQVWRLGREAGHCDVRPVGAVTVGLAGQRARRAGRDGGLGGPRAGLLRRRQVRE